MGSRRVVPPAKPHFFKPFLPGSELELTIPEAFFKHLKGQNCDKAVLRNANGKLWQVKIEGRKLQDGWKEFASDHDLHVGDFVVFRHEGDMLFDVMVFDPSTCEREYSSTPLSQVDVEMENANLDQDGTEKMDSRDSAIETKVTSTFHGVAKSSVIEKPHFKLTVRSNNISRCRMQIPQKFVEQNNLRNTHSEILLLNQLGRSWTAQLKHNSRSGQTFIGAGWSSFCSGNNIKGGTSFIFELMEKEKKPLLKMRGLRKAKEAPKAKADPLIKKKLPTSDITAASLPIRNPYFVAPIFGSIGRRYQLNVPSKFARSNGLTNRRCNMILEDEGGKQWPMSLRPVMNRVSIGNGWCCFKKAKGLKAGDAVIVELVKNGEKPVMKFYGITKVERGKFRTSRA